VSKPTLHVYGVLQRAGRDPRGNETKFVARCPNHPDRNPSLVVSEGEDGRALLFCHTGCTLEDILQASGLTFPELFEEGTPGLGNGYSLSLRQPRPSPGPGVTPEDADEEPELYGLLREHAAGRLAPLPVCLGDMPPTASPTMKRVAGDIALCLGLRWAVDDHRPLPYAAAFCATRNGLRDKRHASRVLRKLTRAGVIYAAGKMPRTGTRLFEAPLGAAAVTASDVTAPEVADPSHGGEIGEELVGVDPAVEVSEHLAVEVAEAVSVSPRGAVGVVATGDGAGDALGRVHGSEHTPDIGAYRPRCCCLDGGTRELTDDGRCGRCYGYREPA
jgi:hypothetical protein